VTKLLASLKHNQIDSKSKIQQKWGESPHFLMDCLGMWLDEEGKKLLKGAWPKLIKY